MISYASIGEIFSEVVSVELELSSICEVRFEDFDSIKCKMVDIPIQMVLVNCKNLSEGDILIVENIDGEIVKVYGKDESEKARRVAYLNSIM